MITPNDPTPFPSTDLHVYLIDDGERWHVIARDEQAALAAYREVNGEMGVVLESIPVIRQVPEDRALSVHGYDDPDSDDVITLTAREWCAKHGEGLLSSTLDF